jgi:uncharacterized protein YbaR (Trm112 family)
MRIETLDILRCPFCGGRLELVASMYHQRSDLEIRDGILGCHCCIFPVIDGIPVLHLQPAATAARAQVEQGRPDLALRTMVGLDNDAQARRFEAAAGSDRSTYREIVEALGPTFEGGYFLYRFSDPTYMVAQAVVRAVAGVVLGDRRRAIDICGGSGHLTRVLMELTETPVLADLHFAKIWLARRFVAPGCEPICCDGNGAFPFARGAFGYAMCSDAFQYIWTKRQFIGEMARLVDAPERPGAVVINHTHNQLTWSPSHGQPLAPAGYRDLFETLPVRIFGEARLLADVVAGGPLDLSRTEPEGALDADPALTLVATEHAGVYEAHRLALPGAARGRYQVNPLYASEPDGDRIELRLQFPSPDYEDEYGACRQYLPERVSVDRVALERLRAGGPGDPALDELVRRRVIVDLPLLYY